METQIIPTHQIGPKIIDLVQAAETRVVLVSPYWKLWGHLEDAMRQTAKRRAAVEILFRADKTDEYKDMKDQFHKLGARVGTIKDLHAKVYHNESACILTSMNLHDYSAQNSEEFALYSTEPSLHQAVTQYTTGLLSKATELRAPSKAAAAFKAAVGVASNAVSTAIANMTSGSCIRCGNNIEWNPDKPMCADCFRSWNQFKNKDYKEKFCHDCGKQHGTTMAKPVCLECFKRAR